MTFAGEAVALDFANVIGGSPFADFGDAMRYNDGAGSTLTAGDSFIAGFFDSALLASGDDVEFSFALVVSGSGSLQLSGGTDPDFTLDDPGDAPTALGTFTVTDSQTIQSAALTRDVDDYLAQLAETIVYVECLSGSVTVEQVKLYIWPPGGAVGGWVATDGFTTTRTPNTWSVGPDDRTFSFTGVGSAATAWDMAEAALTSSWASDRQLEPGILPIGGGDMEANLNAAISAAQDAPILSLLYDSAAIASGNGALAQQPDAMAVTITETTSALAGLGTYGTDVVFSPYEVPGGLGVQLLGSPSVAWGDAEAVIFSAALHRASALFELVGVTDDAPADPTLLTYPLAPGGTAGLGPVTMPTSRTVLLAVGSDVLFGSPGYVDEGDGLETSTASAVFTLTIHLDDCTVTIPPFRYWSPLVTEDPPLRQRNRDKTRARLRPSRQRSIRARGYL